MHRPLRGKKILITAGPTWVPVDRVRVISNVSSGRTGITIAQYAAKVGAEVTLVLGPVPQFASLKIIRFKYFDELKKLLTDELRRKKYDIIIHGAAVADYRPVKTFSHKLKSGKKRLALYLKPTVKLIDEIRQRAKRAFLVMFKLEVERPKTELVALAYKNMLRSKADLIVANNINDITEKRHKAYIIDADRKIIAVGTKEELARRLLGKIAAMQRAR